MRSSRAILYAQRLSELGSQLTNLEDLRSQVDDAEQSARGASGLQLTSHASRHLRSRESCDLPAPPSLHADATCGTSQPI